MNPRNRALLRAIAPLLLMGLIFYFSSQTSTGEHPWWDVIFRKLGHVSGYALLTALWWWALRPLASRPLLLAVAIAFAYACTDEFHQSFVHGRTGTPVDVGIDAIGMAIAASVISRWRPRPRERSGPSSAPASSPS
jgi:VanZ family protein